ncbi:MAG: AAA family ATPase [Vallitalea sp.]|jgi:uncharacterized protein YhaN|nr:AAA family ATPase [Vallitalea sp.]
MYIKKLLIKSFGKYQDKEITLEDGINLVYGSNEAGKSTLHKFIEGMFYGFYKPYVKNKKFTDEYDRYLPWNNSNQYQGILIYDYEGNEYRIERNFMKRNDKVEIFDNITGQNITEEFDYDTAIKQYQPASKHIGINKSTFVNTISIEQLSNKTSDDLVREVKDSLINLGESKDEEISVRNVIDKLNKKLDDIGTAKRKKTTPYGILTEKIKKLKKEKEEAEKNYNVIKNISDDLNKYRLELEELEDTKKQNEQMIYFLDKESIKKKYEDARSIKQYIDDKNNELIHFENYREVHIKEIDDTIKNINIRQVNIEQKEDIENQLLTIDNYINKQHKKYHQVSSLEEEDIESVDNIIGDYSLYNDFINRFNINEDKIIELKSKLNSHKSINNIEEDVYTYNILDEEKKQISTNKSSTDVEINKIEKRKDTYISRYKQSKLISVMSIIIFFGLLIFGIISNNSIMLTSSSIGVIILVISIVNIRKCIIEIKKIKQHINKQVNIQQNIENKLNNISREQMQILEKYNCDSIMKLWELKDKMLHVNALYEDNKTRCEDLIKENNKLQDDINSIKHRLIYFTKLLLNTDEINNSNIHIIKEKVNLYKDTKTVIINKQREKEEVSARLEAIDNVIIKLNNQIEKVCKKYQAYSEDELVEVKENRYKYYSILQDVDNNKVLLDKLLENTSIEELENKLTIKEHENAIVTKSREQLLSEQDILIDKILHKNKEISSYETKITNLENSTRKLVDIEEEIESSINKKLEYDNKINAITIAKESIEQISKDIQNNFAPKLNEKVSNIISSITNKKYTDIKINPNMDILTYEPDNNSLIGIDKLSKGTIDQMYFGLRLGIIDIIKEDITLPLILDDCFVQYDIHRLENVIETLNKLDRQIIILSCHEREKEILSSMKINHNLINL